MIDTHIFLMGLLIVSATSSLVTEAIKKLLNERNKTYPANALVSIVAIVVSICVAVCYIAIAHIAFSTEVAVNIFALVVLSWLVAMLGYDKVIQTFSQLKMEGKDD